MAVTAVEANLAKGTCGGRKGGGGIFTYNRIQCFSDTIKNKKYVAEEVDKK
jgi:hypothetical protein